MASASAVPVDAQGPVAPTSWLPPTVKAIAARLSADCHYPDVLADLIAGYALPLSIEWSAAGSECGWFTLSDHSRTARRLPETTTAAAAWVLSEQPVRGLPRRFALKIIANAGLNGLLCGPTAHTPAEYTAFVTAPAPPPAD